MNTTDKIMALAEEQAAAFGHVAHHDADPKTILPRAEAVQLLKKNHEALRAEIEALVRDAERYRFIRDAGRSECIEYEIRTYSMETLDEYVDAAIEDEAAMQEKQS